MLKREQTPYGAVQWGVRPLEALDAELTAVYRLPIDVARKAGALSLIANALNRGDRALAAIGAVQMQFPDPPPLAKGAESRTEIERRALELYRSGLLKFWDPAKHPRTGVPPNPGWFGTGSGEAGAVLAGMGASEESEEQEEIKENHIGRPTHHVGHHGKDPGIPLLDIQPPLPLGVPGQVRPSSATGASPKPPTPPVRPSAPYEPPPKLPLQPQPPQLAPFKEGGKTSAIFRAGDFVQELRSGYDGPASMMRGSAGFDINTLSHVEGHAAALMRQKGIMEATLEINNPEICVSCDRLLPKMLPPGATLNIVLPDGTIRSYKGRAQ
jgi:hypothetical protein